MTDDFAAALISALILGIFTNFSFVFFLKTLCYQISDERFNRQRRWKTARIRASSF